MTGPALSQPADSPTGSRRFFGELESLRGIAALTVAFFHISWMNPFYELGFIRNGYLMVDLFFVLSGFVICHSYGQNISNGRALVRFMWLRLGRLYPLHFALLLVFVGFEVLKYGGEATFGLTAKNPPFSHNDLQAFVANLFLIQSLGVLNDLHFNYPSWTISLEFYTYLLFAVVLLFVRSRTGLILVSAVLIFSGILLLLRLGETNLGASYEYGYFRSVAGFFLGVITYQILPFWRQLFGGDKRFMYLLFLPGLFVGIVIFQSLKNDGYSDFAVLPLAALLILALTSTSKGPINYLLTLKPLAWLGKVSYSIYMVHAAVIWVLVQVLRIFNSPTITVEGLKGADQTILNPSPVVGFLFFCISIAALLVSSHFTYKWIESPFRRKSRELADRFQLTESVKKIFDR